MDKSIFKSKTFYFGLITALAPLSPGFAEWFKGNEAMVVSIWGLLAMVLRVVTKDKVVLGL